MKSKILIFTALTVSLLAAGCSKQKEYDFSWLDGIAGECPEGVKDFNDRYKVLLTNSISSQTYSFDGSYTLQTDWTPATDAQTEAVADFLEKEIFPLFPEGFIAQYMPSTMYVADSVRFEWTYELKDYDPVSGKDISRTVENVRNLGGEVGGKQITFSASALETRDRDSLRYEWTSLIIERMMSNTTYWSEPTDFTQPSEDRMYEYYQMSYFKFYQTSLGKKGTTFGEPMTPYPDRFNLYYYCGAFRPCRYGYHLHYYYSAEFAHAGAYGDEATEGFVYYIMTYQQNFGDMLALLLCKSSSEIEDMIQRAAKQTTEKETSVYNSDGTKTTTTETITVGREIFDTKIAAVKAYMKKNFDWEIK